MKPRLRFSRGSWSCAAVNWHITRIVGYGYTAQEAYADWLALGGEVGRG